MKNRAVILLLLSLVLTGLIATGLSRMTFQPGMPIPSFEKGQVSLPAPERESVGMGMRPFAAILLLIVLGVSFLAIVIRAMWGAPWKRLLAGAWSLFWKLALAAGVVLLVVTLLPKSGSSAPAVPLPPPRPLATEPLGPVRPALIWIAGIALGLAVILLGLRMLLSRPHEPPRSWELEVARARQALLDGADLREVIIRCYARMSEALQEEQGIERETSMTTGEFETLLAGKGLPRDPVRQLTRLFESARYSLRQPVPGEEQSAIRCLDAILDHVRQAKLAEAAETAKAPKPPAKPAAEAS